MLRPLASTLETLNLGLNKLGGTITGDITAFTKLSELYLSNMGLEGAWYDQTYPHENETERGVRLPLGTKQELKDLLPNCGSIYI